MRLLIAIALATSLAGCANSRAGFSEGVFWGLVGIAVDAGLADPEPPTPEPLEEVE